MRNIEAPAPSLNEDVKAVLDYLDIQKPTGIGMLLTEIGKLQDKGLNPIFSKKVDEHMQSHSCQEIVSRGIQTQLVEAFLGNKMTDLLKSSYIKPILTTIDNVADSRRGAIDLCDSPWWRRYLRLRPSGLVERARHT